MPRPAPRPGSWRAFDVDAPSPKKPLKLKTILELSAGRRMGRATRLQETMPKDTFERFLEWDTQWQTSHGPSVS